MENLDDDKLIAIFCLYKDLNDLRREIARLWLGYFHEERDLQGVSIATDFAFELAASLESTLLESYADLDGCEKIFSTLLRTLIAAGFTIFGDISRIDEKKFVLPVVFHEWSFLYTV